MIPNRHFTHLLFVILLTCFAIETKGAHTDYNDVEQSAIDELRPLIANYLVPDYMKTDVYHLRLLKASKFDVKNAVQMVKRNTKWRKHNNVDEILNEDLHEYFPDFPYKLDGVDKEGRSIIQYYYGKWKLRKYTLSDDIELRKVPLKIFIHAFETAEHKLFEIQKSGGQNISSAFALNDVDGYSIQGNACPQCLYVTAQFMKACTHYPSLIKKAIQINAPKIFAKVIQLMNEILPPEVSRIISNYSYNDNSWRDEILKDISADQLPKDFGGTKENWFNKD